MAHHFAAAGVSNSADRLLARVLLSAMLAMGVMMLSLSLYGSLLGERADFESGSAAAFEGLLRMAALAVSAPVVALLGVPLANAVWQMRRWLSADALVVLGTCAAYLVSIWNTFRGGGEVYYDTATMVLVLVSLGRWLDLRAKERARAELQFALPAGLASVVVLRGEEEHELAPSEVQQGDIVRVRPGELVQVDGHVVSGSSFVDSSSLTGEAESRSLHVGDSVLAGCRLVDGTLDVEARAVGADRLCAEIERLLERALLNPAPEQRLADRVAQFLIPLVLLLAVATAAWHWRHSGPESGLLSALSVLLIACPCALGIATPLAFWVALGKAWKSGVLVQGGAVLERLARAERIWIDKTGTLTDGRHELQRILCFADLSELDALRVAASLERGSEHPLGRSIRRAWSASFAAGSKRSAALLDVEGFRALPGIGVAGRIDGMDWRLQKGGASGELQLLRGDVLIAKFELLARARPEAVSVIQQLRELGLEPIVLTGDAHEPAQRLAAELGLEVVSDLLPQDKVAHIQSAKGARSIFVGDGLNDAAALASAGVGISVAGSSARSMDVADVNFLRPGLAGLPGLVRLARAATRTARWNLFWAFGYNAVALGFAISGHLPPIFAAMAMVASSVAVILNSGRLARFVVSDRAVRTDDVEPARTTRETSQQMASHLEPASHAGR